MTTEDKRSETETSHLGDAEEKKVDEKKVDEKVSGSKAEEKKEDVISYAKYRELLDETKKEREKRQNYETKLKEQNRWKELFEKSKAEAQSLKDAAEQERKAFIESKKLSKFLQKIGGLKNESYQNFVDTSKILYSEGKIDENSLDAYADEFKTNYPELLKQLERKETLPNKAPKSGEKSYSKMSYDELSTFLRNNT